MAAKIRVSDSLFSVADQIVLALGDHVDSALGKHLDQGLERVCPRQGGFLKSHVQQDVLADVLDDGADPVLFHFVEPHHPDMGVAAGHEDNIVGLDGAGPFDAERASLLCPGGAEQARPRL